MLLHKKNTVRVPEVKHVCDGQQAGEGMTFRQGLFERASKQSRKIRGGDKKRGKIWICLLLEQEVEQWLRKKHEGAGLRTHVCNHTGHNVHRDCVRVTLLLFRTTN